MPMPDRYGELSGKVVLLTHFRLEFEASSKAWLDLLISTPQAIDFEKSMSELCSSCTLMICSSVGARRVATGGALRCERCFHPTTGEDSCTRYSGFTLLQESERQGDLSYRETVDSLMEVSVISTPDVANSVREMPRYPHNPSMSY